MSELDDIHDTYDAILQENEELLTQFLHTDDLLWGNIEAYLIAAIERGNTKIIQIILEAWRSEILTDYIDSNVLRIITFLRFDEDKKLEIIKVLLPKFNLNLKFYPIDYLFAVILGSCTQKNFILAEFFIKNLYSEKYNSLHPLIKRLEGAVYGWPSICILLHDEMDYQKYQITENIPDSLKTKHLKDIAETFLTLLQKNTRESMELAVETAQLLLDKNFAGLIIFLDILKSSSTINSVLNGHTKLLFQFIYRSINDKTQAKIYTIIDFWFYFHDIFLHDDDAALQHTLVLSKQLLDPFMSQPYAQKSCSFDDMMSLKYIARNVIRHKVFKNVSNIKEFMDRIWELNLPLTVKCFLLNIPEPSWMNFEMPFTQK